MQAHAVSTLDHKHIAEFDTVKTSTGSSSNSTASPPTDVKLALVPESNMRTKQELRRTGLYHPNSIIFKFFGNNPQPDFQSMTAYVKTSRPDHLSQLFKQALVNEKNARPARLLQAAAHGDPDTVEKIIRKSPELLLHKGLVKDFSGREIEGTAYQIALGAEDVSMARMIQRYLMKLPHGKSEIIKQENEQFPRDVKNDDGARDLQALNNVINSIIDWLIGLPKPLELEYMNKVYELEESKKMAYVSFAEKLGIEKGKMDVAKHLLEDGAKPTYVKKITGLSSAKIKQLQQKLKQKSH